MSYALIRDGKIAAYPYSFARLKADNPDTSYPERPGDEFLASHDIHPVIRVDQPVASSLSKNVVEGAPALIKGIWTQTWTEIDASPEEIAAREKAEVDAASKIAVRQDAFVANFVAMTPAQVEAYISANVTSLATAKDVISKLAKMVLILARREFG